MNSIINIIIYLINFNLALEFLKKMLKKDIDERIDL